MILESSGTGNHVTYSNLVLKEREHKLINRLRIKWKTLKKNKGLFDCKRDHAEVNVDLMKITRKDMTMWRKLLMEHNEETQIMDDRDINETNEA